MRVSEQSYNAWRDFCGFYGVSMGAVIEAMGERFGAILNKTGEPLTGSGREIVTRAREIDQAHRSRRKGRDEE